MSVEKETDDRITRSWDIVNPSRSPTPEDLAASKAMADQTVAMLYERRHFEDEFGLSEFGREFVRRVLIEHRRSRNDDYVEYIDPEGIFDPDDPTQVSGARFFILASNPEVAHVLRLGHDVYPILDCILKISDKCDGFGDFNSFLANGQYVVAVTYCGTCREWLSKNVGKLEEFDV